MDRDMTTAGLLVLLDEEQSRAIDELLREHGSSLDRAVRFLDLDRINACRNALIAAGDADQSTIDALKSLREEVLEAKRNALGVGDLDYLNERRRWVVDVDPAGSLVRAFDDLRSEADSALARDDRKLAVSIAHHLELLAESARDAADRQTFIADYTYSTEGSTGPRVAAHQQIADLLACTPDQVREIFAADALRCRGSEFPLHLEALWSRFFDLWHSALLSDNELRAEQVEAVRRTRALRGAILAVEREALAEARAGKCRRQRSEPRFRARRPWAARRIACRPRASRGRAGRTRGSRRTANASGGGDPPDGDADEPGERSQSPVRWDLLAAIVFIAAALPQSGEVAKAIDRAERLLMVETLDPHSPEWWRPDGQNSHVEREAVRQVEAGSDALTHAGHPSPVEIAEIVSDAIGWFDTHRPCAKDPDSFCAEYDHFMLEDVEAAVRKAGYDLSDPEVDACMWESYWDSKHDGSWVGRLRRNATPENRILHLINGRLSNQASLEELREALVAGVRWGTTGEAPSQRAEVLYCLFDDLQTTAQTPEQLADLLHFSLEEGIEASGLLGAMRRLEQMAVAEANARERRTVVIDAFRGRSHRFLRRQGHHWMVRSREHRGVCASRTRGSKRGGSTSRSSGSDPPGGDDGPGEKPRREYLTASLCQGDRARGWRFRTSLTDADRFPGVLGTRVRSSPLIQESASGLLSGSQGLSQCFAQCAGAGQWPFSTEVNPRLRGGGRP